MSSETSTLGLQENTNLDILDLLEQEETQNSSENIDLLEEVNLSDNENVDLLENIELVEKTEDTQVMNEDIFAEYNTNYEIEAIAEEKIEEKNKFKELLKFLASYITTSGAIFVLLIVGTNYSAYFQIAKSYLSDGDSTKMSASLETKIVDPEVVELNSATKAEEEENKNYHSMTKLIYEANNENINLDINIAPYENRIIIPKIGKNIPLVNVENKQVTNVKELEDVFMKELEKWVVRYPGSGIPWENGNMFIFGHSSNFPWIKWDYNDIFATLDKVVFNDEIIVYYNQKKYTYKIREKKVIKPGEVSILKRDSGKSEISLMTCYPIWTSINRLVVIWELVENK